MLIYDAPALLPLENAKATRLACTSCVPKVVTCACKLTMNDASRFQGSRPILHDCFSHARRNGDDDDDDDV